MRPVPHWRWPPSHDHHTSTIVTTHIAIGGVFGVGFFREAVEARRMRQMSGEGAACLLPIEERQRRKLVRRSHFMTILAAWIVTVPATAVVSAGLFFVLRFLRSLPNV